MIQEFECDVRGRAGHTCRRFVARALTEKPVSPAATARLGAAADGLPDGPPSRSVR